MLINTKIDIDQQYSIINHIMPSKTKFIFKKKITASQNAIFQILFKHLTKSFAVIKNYSKSF